LDQTFPDPTDFDLEAYLAADPFFQPAVRARLRFAPEAAVVALDNRAYWETMEVQPDGALVVTFAVPDLEAAAGQVLRIGFGAVILEPEGLHALVRAQARALADHFGAGTVSADGRPVSQQEEV